MFSNESKYQSPFGEIKHSYAYEKFHFKGYTKGIAIKYVKEGSECYLIDNEVIDVQKGQFILVREGQKFEAQAKLKAQNIKGLCIDLNPTALEIDLDKMYNNPIFFNLPFDCLHFSPLGENLDQLRSNALSNNLSKHQILETLNKEMHTFADDIYTIHLRLSSSTTKIDTQKAILIKLLSAKNYIHQHFTQKIKLDHLAKFAGISKYHFIRLFKRCFQQSPLELQHQLRMNKASKLVKDATSNLCSIAYDLGYTDLAIFSNTFKKHFGWSPSQYRKMIN